MSTPLRKIIEDKAAHLVARIEDRQEWMAWQAMFGSITVNENNVGSGSGMPVGMPELPTWMEDRKFKRWINRPFTLT